MTDPITDMLNRIKNAMAAQKPEVLVPFSKLKNEVANVLMREKFVGGVKRITKGKVKFLKINLEYQQGVPSLEGVKRVSKPGQRIYVKANEIKKIKQGFGVSVISTSKGLMTGKEARKARLGGEVLLEVW